MKKELLSKLSGLRAKLQPVSNREVLDEIIDIEIRLENEL